MVKYGKSIWVWSAIGAFSVAVPALAVESGAKAKSPIVGRWDITISEGERTAPSWLGVQEKDGALVAEFLGTGGGVHGIDVPKFENDTITFKVGNREWTGKVSGDTIEGTCGKDKFVAHRFVRKINVSGKWDLKVGAKSATLSLTQHGDKISGKWTEDGKGTAISEASLHANHLHFTVGDKKVMVLVKGDVIESHHGDGITGHRERKWAKPVALLEGEPSDLANWEPLYKKDLSWKIVDGVMTNGRNGTENIVTKRKDFQNFKLHVEFKVPQGGNSGVYLRGRDEIQVEDSYGKEPNASNCGALYSRIVPRPNVSKKPGEWQTFDITLIDSYVTVVYNGQTVLDNQEIEGITGGAIDSNEADPGPIYLQGDHTQVWYRKVLLTPTE